MTLNVLLANEAGIGRGHVVKLATTAHAIGRLRPDARITAGLARHKHADELTRFGIPVLACPVMGYTPEAVADPLLEGNATWGDYLFAMGLARRDLLRAALTWWQQTIVAGDVSLLVTDYAPIAMLAARGLKAQGWQIEVISTGTAYSVPPADLAEFPQLLPDYPRSIHPEPVVLAMLNEVMAEFDFPPLPSLPAIYDVALPLPASLDFLDPYRKLRPSALLPPQIDHSADLADAGREVFVYFSTKELDDPAVVDALAELPLPRRGFLPGADAATRARLAASGMITLDRPASIEDITVQSRLMLHSAQHGSICMAAFAGLPQVALPQHLEQVFHGRRAGQQGVLDQLEQRQRSKAAVLDMVHRLYHDAAIARRARDFAAALRADAPPDAGAVLLDRLAPLLARLP